MSVKGGPGQGGSFSLSVDTTLSRIRSVQLPSHSTDPVDFTGLSDLDWFCLLAANLKNGGVAIVEMYHNTEIVEPTVRVQQTATILLPIQTSGNANPQTLTGSGFVIELGLPNMAVGEPMIQTVAFQFDANGVNPSITPETA